MSSETQLEMLADDARNVRMILSWQIYLISKMRDRGLSPGHADKLLDVCQWMQAQISVGQLQKIPAAFRQWGSEQQDN